MKTKLIIFIITVIAPVVVCTQNRHVQRVFTDTDTCRVLQIIGKANHLSYSGRLHLLDEHQCIKEEKIILKNNITWLSIPRHIRNVDDETTHIEDVFNQDNISGSSYTQLHLEHNKIQNLSNNLIVANWFWQTGWTYDDDMNHINSIRGYKLQIWPGESRTLSLHGATEDPNTELTIYTNPNQDLENWVGYWLYEEQSPFDAIPQNVLDVLTSIKAQDWYCYRDNPSTKSGNASGPWVCALNIGINGPRLKYGDMVILRSDAYVTFQWQNNYSPPPTEVKAAASYYQYEEKPDYTAYMIDIDTSNRPLEIGAFIGDSCIGATTVLPDDTLVLIRGYDKDTTGEITFENHYGTKSSQAIHDYYVKAPGEHLWQKRKINAAERKEYYRVSFKTQKAEKPAADDFSLLFKAYPNPVQDRISVQYLNEEKGIVLIEFYDLTGKKVFKHAVQKPAGINKTNLNIRDLKNGVYLLKLSTGEQMDIKQIVINK